MPVSTSPTVLLVLGVSGSGKIAAVDGCIIGTLNTTAAVAGGGGEHRPGTLETGDGSQSVTADGSPPPQLTGEHSPGI